MKCLVCAVLSLVFVIQLSGCSLMFGADDKMRALHPAGYAKIAQICPICESKPSTLGCVTGAAILEAPSPERATAIFIKDWERMVIDSVFRGKERRAEMRRDFTDTIMYSRMQQNCAVGLNNNAIPALQEVYRENPSEYSKRMSRVLDIVDIESRSSFDTFRESHLKALN